MGLGGLEIYRGLGGDLADLHPQNLWIIGVVVPRKSEVQVLRSNSREVSLEVFGQPLTITSAVRIRSGLPVIPVAAWGERLTCVSVGSHADAKGQGQDSSNDHILIY